MNFYALKNTKYWKNYWVKRKKDWTKDYAETINHPHRKIIINILKNISWLSLLEIGCNSAPNLINIIKNIPGRQVGGIDVNSDAIETAKKTMPNGFFKVNSADDIMISDKSVDVILSDMALIYVSPKDIDKYIKEIKRVARNYILFCEFHSKNWYNRLVLKLNSGYNAYNYKKLLEKHGFYDIAIQKLTEEDWPGGNPQKTFAYFIIAKIPKN
jgi:ubiquinone/menaquinone biosynthesis C-methylase UbiE